MRRVLWLCGFCLCTAALSAQRVSLSDSLVQVFRQPIAPVLKLDTRNSFITGRGVQIWGVKGGVSFGRRLNLGAAFSWLYSELDQPVRLEGREVMAKVGLWYAGPFAEYTFYRKGPWEATVPVQLGWGRSFLRAPETRGERFRDGTIWLYEPAMVVDYGIFDLVAVGAGVGYRLMLVGNRELDQSFTAPVYMIRVRLLTDRWKNLLRG